MKLPVHVVCSLAFWLGIAAPSNARAWYFPEHAELGRLALQDQGTPFTRRVIADVVSAAAADGLTLCQGTSLPFARVALERDDIAQCVPYAALAALAGDHASTTGELREALTVGMFRPWPNDNVQLARLLTGAAAVTWRNYFAKEPTNQLRVWTGLVRDGGTASDDAGQTLEGRNFIARLDIELLAIDPGYVSRAAGSESHFHNAGLPMHQLLDNMLAGDLDNALAQLLVHHARSLQLAVRARTAKAQSERNALLSEALLEHAFALHFLEDAFASGHLATDPAFLVETRRKQRHDYFNRQGLEVTYALDAGNCRHDVNELDREAAIYRSPGSNRPRPSRCWVAHGDGYAGMPDRVHVGDAVARVQTEFAIAAWDGACDSASGCADAAHFLYFTGEGNVTSGPLTAEAANPAAATAKPSQGPDVAPAQATAGQAARAGDPSIEQPKPAVPSVPSEETGSAEPLKTLMSWRPRGGASVARLPTIAELEAALTALGNTPLPPPRSAGDPATQRFGGDGAWLGCPLKEQEAGSCSYDPTQGSSVLWRAILAVWPTSTASTETLEGSDSAEDGSSLQLNFGVSAGCVRPLLCQQGFVLGAAGTVGYAYRLAGLFPHRRALAIAELNVGPAFVARLGGAGSDGKSERVLGAVVAEVRSPLTTLLVYLTGYVWRTRTPISLVGNPLAVGLFGARAILQPRGSGFDVRGWDVELLDYRLNSGEAPNPAAVGAAEDTELRVHLGYANFENSMRDLSNGSVMLNVDVASGYYRFF